MKRLRSMGAEETSTDEKTSDFGAKTSRYSSKFKILNSKFELQASFCITNLNYEASAKYGRRGGFHGGEHTEKQ